MSTLRYAPQVISDAIAELNNRKAWLDDIYEVIVNNPCSVTVVKDNYADYDTYTHDIIDNMSTKITAYEGYFADIATAITTKHGVIIDSTKYEDYDSYILSIPQSGGGGEDTSELEGYLNDVYTVLSQNTVSVSVTSGAYDTFDQAISDIYDAYDAIITGKDNTIYSLTSTVNTYEMDFGAIYTAIVNKGGTCTQNDYSTYAAGVNSIPTSGGSTTTLEGYLDDIYDVISKNDVGVTVVEGAYQDYDSNTSAIISALKSQISTLQSQLSTANQTITAYQGYFADIATAITNKGGTVTDQSAYADFDDYVTGIPSGSTPVVQHGTLDWFKLPQNRNLTGMDFREITSGKGSIVVFPENSSYLFANLGVPEYNSDGTQNEDYYDFRFYADKFDMSACTNIEGVFSNSCLDTFLPLTSNFCKSVQGDVTLDLTTFNNVDFDNFKNSIEKNTTGFKREFLLKHEHYESNVNYGGVRTLRNKGYTITDANPEGE